MDKKAALYALAKDLGYQVRVTPIMVKYSDENGEIVLSGLPIDQLIDLALQRLQSEKHKK